MQTRERTHCAPSVFPFIKKKKILGTVKKVTSVLSLKEFDNSDVYDMLLKRGNLVLLEFLWNAPTVLPYLFFQG